MSQRICSVDDCGRPPYVRGWCVKHYSRWRAHGDPEAYFPNTPDAAERFWTHVDRSAGPNGCWRWLGWIDHYGYGRFTAKDADGKWGSEKAYRWIYTEAVGPISPGSHLDHMCHQRDSCHGGTSCPHRACVNPRHLREVSPVTNIRRGAAAKLTYEQAQEIRRRRESGERGVDLAREFGVSKSNISFITTGATWKP